MSNFKILSPPSDSHDNVHIVLASRLTGAIVGCGCQGISPAWPVFCC